MSGPAARSSKSVSPTTPVAIIGMACIFPRAPDLRTYWNNILNKVDAVGEPVESWGAARYLDSGRIKTESGGFLRDLYRFDPTEFGIMPNSINGSEPDQFLALRVARDALADAGYARPEVDHSATGIVLGHSTYLHRGQGTLIQQNIVLDQTLELLKLAMPHLDADALGRLREVLQKKLPPTNADTVPGLVPNVMTGRIANRLNLHGPNYLLDAACSSSLLAVAAAIDELHAGRSRMMLAGGVNATLPAEVTTIFTQLGALTTRRKVRPFSVGSDGTLLGEGLGVVVLKRLADAIADNDRIYAVVRGVGQSSDGRGSGLLAPSQEGETLAIRRTYDASQTDPATIGLFEAHGTGIPLGDQTEIASLKAVFGERTTPRGTIALGSVKSMISHCIPAAGIAGLIKMALSVHHKILPPTLCEEVNPALGIEQTPFYVNTQLAPWISRIGKPRRAAVNAFGFGGTNAHAILEEAPQGATVPESLTEWPSELCVLSDSSAAALATRLETLAASIGRNPSWRISEIAAALARADQGGEHRISIVAADPAALVKSIGQAVTRLRKAAEARWQTRTGIAYSARRASGKLAFIFPGEGSQYQGMFSELALCFPQIRQWLDFWHGLHDLPRGRTRTDIAFPTAEAGAETRAQLENDLQAMDVGSEAVYIGGLAMHALLTSLGIQPDVMLGHSSGESAALSASGANPAVTGQQQAECITRHHAAYVRLLESGKIPTGALLAVGAADPTTVQAAIANAAGVVVAMDNCTNQTVLYGPPEGIARAQTELTRAGAVCLPLPFDRGYHTEAFREASEAFLEYYKDIRLGVPEVPLYSCAIAGLFPDKPAAVRKLAAAQWASKVRFRETIQKMHDDGVALFVEVGPSANLTTFVQDNLRGREFVAAASNVRRRGEMEQLLGLLGQLYVAGRGPAFEQLFAPRAIASIDLAASPARPRGMVLDNTMPMIRLSESDRAVIREIVSRDLTPAAPPAGVAQPASAAATGAPAGAASAAMPAPTAMPAQTAMPVPPAPTAPTAMPAMTADSLTGWPLGSTHANDSATPLLDEIVEHSADHLVARSHIGFANDNFVRHHVMTGPVSGSDPDLFGLSCVPLAVSLEIMAEACALLAGSTDVKVIENLSAFDWIALDEDTVSLEVRAETVDRAADLFRASLITPRGTALTADFRFAPEWRLEPTPPLLERRASCWNSPDLYCTGMFHGPIFQSLRYIDAWDDTGVDVHLSEGALEHFFAEGHTPRLVLNPVLLDALGQVVACWLVQFYGTEFNNFPSTIGRIELYQPCPTGRNVMMRARQRLAGVQSTDPGAPRAWEFECVNGNGDVLFRGRDLVNVFWQMPSAYHAVRWRPLLGWLGHEASSGSDAELQWEIPWLPADFLAQSGAICLRTLAHVFLSAAEREEWRAVRGPVRARMEWLFDRAVLKEAVRHWIHLRTGHLLYPSDVETFVSEHGTATVSGWWTQTLIAAPAVQVERGTGTSIASVSSAAIQMEGPSDVHPPGPGNENFARS